MYNTHNIYIYIYIERERNIDRERETENNKTHMLYQKGEIHMHLG